MEQIACKRIWNILFHVKIMAFKNPYRGWSSQFILDSKYFFNIFSNIFLFGVSSASRALYLFAVIFIYLSYIQSLQIEGIAQIIPLTQHNIKAKALNATHGSNLNC